MNIKEIYNEIEEEKHNMAEVLKEEKSSRMIKPFTLKDFKYNLSFCFIAFILNTFNFFLLKSPSLLLNNLALLLLSVPMFYIIYDLSYISLIKRPKNLCISYFLMSAFKKKRLEEFDAQNRYNIASNEIVSNDFLKRIAFHMNEHEFELLLTKSDGKITLNSIEEFVKESQDLESKKNNIKNLTKAIYTENKKISE